MYLKHRMSRCFKTTPGTISNYLFWGTDMPRLNDVAHVHHRHDESFFHPFRVRAHCHRRRGV